MDDQKLVTFKKVDTSALAGAASDVAGSIEAGQNPLTSKTMWLGVLMAVAPLYPPALVVMQTYPALSGIVSAGLVWAARHFTDQSLDWSKLKFWS